MRMLIKLSLLRVAVLSTTAWLGTFQSLLPATRALQVTYPAGGQSWVSCKLNPLTWSADSTDPEYFSVELFNKNDHMLNGNFQIGNAVETRNGSALLTPNCVPPGSGYYFELVNASQFEKDKPQVYYTSPEFSIEPNTAQVQTPSGYSLTNNGTQLVGGTGTAIGNGTKSDTSTTTNNATDTMSTSTTESTTSGAPTSGLNLVTPASANKSASTTHKNGGAKAALLVTPNGIPWCLASLLLAGAIALSIL